jgi:hypothetical protein
MASRRKIVLPSPNSVGAGQTATLSLPTGRRYFSLFLYYKLTANQATIEADVTEIRILVNGIVQRRFSAADLNMVNALNGFAFKAGLLPIFFAEPWRRTVMGEEGLTWGTANVDTFQVQIDIAGTAVAPALYAVAEVDSENVPLAGVVKWYKETYTSGGAAVLTITTLPKLDAYLRIHARSALVTKAKVVLDSVEVYEATLTEATHWIARRGYTMQANNYNLLFDDDSQVTSAKPMVKQIGVQNGRPVFKQLDEFRLDLTCSGAGSIPVLVERFGNPD